MNLGCTFCHLYADSTYKFSDNGNAAAYPVHLTLSFYNDILEFSGQYSSKHYHYLFACGEPVSSCMYLLHKGIYHIHATENFRGEDTDLCVRGDQIHI